MARLRYSAVVDAIAGLHQRGFVEDFHLISDQLQCLQKQRMLRPQEFDITEIHYFPAGKAMANEMMLYGIESPAHGLKGLLLIGGRENISTTASMLHQKLTDDLLQSRPSHQSGLL